MCKRFFFLLCVVACSSVVKTQSLSSATESALTYLYNGYVEYAIQELIKLSKTNDLSAQYYLAVCYDCGVVLQKDVAEAFKLYRRTAERGLPDAMYQIAMHYKNGIYVPQNNAKCAEWIQRFERKGGKNILPDIIEIFNEGVKQPANYAVNPTVSGGIVQNHTTNNHVNVGNNVNSNNTTTINITYATPSPVQVAAVTPAVVSDSNNSRPQSDVDVDIPQGVENNESTFVVIIANEDYQEVADVPYTTNDGEIFAEYCKKTLGIPESNISLTKNATANNMKREIRWLTQILEQYKGEAKAIIYYAGHGIPDERSKDAYLLPVDGYGDDPTTGYSLGELYKNLNEVPSKSVMIFLDACFSGTNREGNMLASARGVAIKAKPAEPKGNMIVFSAAQGDETAYPYNEKGHGLFTYYFLKNLQESEGNVTLGELVEYVTDQVGKQSIVVNRKSQTPTISVSSSMQESWMRMKLK